MKKYCLSVAIILAMSAFAAEAEAAEAVADEFAGPYVGLQAGNIWGDADTSSWHSDPEDTHAFSLNGFGVDGFAGGIFAGHMWRVNNDILFGIEVEVNWASADDMVINNDEPDFPYGAKVEQERDASLMLRVGKDMGGYMPYITAGIARAEVKVNGFTDWDSYKYGPNRYDSNDAKLSGWTVGVGAEKKFGENLRVHIQYRYSDYGDDTWVIAEPNDVNRGKIEHDNHMLNVGLSYRF